MARARRVLDRRVDRGVPRVRLRSGASGSDAWNYLAAGERLNAGHPLYALSPGDRPVPLAPPYWTVPLLAPPPIAVAWRPLALLGDPAMGVWAGAGLIVTLLTAGTLLAGGGIAVAAIIALMSAPLALQSLSGNVNGLLFGALVVAWLARDRAPIVGTLVAAAIAIKLTPVLLLVWLASAGRWRALGATLVALAVIGVVSLLGGASRTISTGWRPCRRRHPPRCRSLPSPACRRS